MDYTVGASTAEDGWYVRMPWHLRGTVQELLALAWADGRIPEGCAGIEFWDGGVQFERHRFPWTEDGDD